eukprot:1620453-Prymnesium_polylepis.2
MSSRDGHPPDVQTPTTHTPKGGGAARARVGGAIGDVQRGASGGCWGAGCVVCERTGARYGGAGVFMVCGLCVREDKWICAQWRGEHAR